MNSLKAVSHPNSDTDLVVVMGIAGSGKSTLSSLLANAYGFTYLDADDFHSQASRDMMARGIPLTDVERGPWVESICKELQQRLRDRSPVVLAFSGLKKKHREMIRQVGLKTLFLFLNGEKTIIRDRVNGRKGHYMAASMLDSQLASLEDPRLESDVFSVNIDPALPDVSAQAEKILKEQRVFAPKTRQNSNR